MRAPPKCVRIDPNGISRSQEPLLGLFLLSSPLRPLPSPTWPFFIVIGLVAGEHSRINPGEPCIVTRSKHDRRGRSLLTLEILADFRENDGLGLRRRFE